MRFRSFYALALAASLVTASAPARADEPSPENVAMARQLGTQGQEAFDKKDFAEAEKLFAAASKLYPLAPTLTLGLARSQAALGKVVAAQESYNKIVREWGSATSAPPAFKAAAESARNEVGVVSARMASVVLQVEGAPSPLVTLDGATVPSVALGLRRPVDPGTHLVKASAEGMKPTESSFTVPDGGHAEVKLKLEKDAGAGAAATTVPVDAHPTEPPPAETAKRGSGQKTLALAALGVGAAGLVVGGITGVLALGKASDLDAACPDGRCPEGRQGDIDSYKTMGTLSTVGFIVGGVGVATGAVLFFTAPKGETQKAAVRPVIGPGSVGFVGRF